MDTTADVWRQRILQYLRDHGPVNDRSGFAATQVARALGWSEHSSRFSALLASLERQGKLRRQVRGKRTYRLELAAGTPAQPPRAARPPLPAARPALPAAHRAPMPAPVAGAGTPGAPDPVRQLSAWQRRCLERTLGQLDQARRELAQTRAAYQQLLEQNRVLQQRLERAERNLQVLSARRRPQPAPAPAWAPRLPTAQRGGRWPVGSAR